MDTNSNQANDCFDSDPIDPLKSSSHPLAKSTSHENDNSFLLASSASTSNFSSSNNSDSSSHKLDHILLRLLFSPGEYHTLYTALYQRYPPLTKSLIHPCHYNSSIVNSSFEYAFQAGRASFRIFCGSLTIIKAFNSLSLMLPRNSKSDKSIHLNHGSERWLNWKIQVALALSLITLMGRLTFHSIQNVRLILFSVMPKTFPLNYPLVYHILLKSKGFSLIAASLIGGSFWSLLPENPLRVTLSIYILSRALESLYNFLQFRGFIHPTLSWFCRSWILMPLSCAQLLYTYVYHRSCIPSSYASFAMKFSGPYIKLRPKEYPLTLSWPDKNQIVDGLSEISDMNWPKFVSPVLYPDYIASFPLALKSLAPIIMPAHPRISYLSCALLHPNDPSCLCTQIKFHLTVLPKITRSLATAIVTLSLLKLFVRRLTFKSGQVMKTRLSMKFCYNFLLRILRISSMLSASLGTAWFCICAFNRIISPQFIPRARWALAGALAGLWGFFERNNSFANAIFFYSARSAASSVYYRSIYNPPNTKFPRANYDVTLFLTGLVILQLIKSNSSQSLPGSALNRFCSMILGN